MLASRLIGKVALRWMLVWGNGASLVAAVARLAVVVSGHLAVVIMMRLMFAFTVGAGVASPAALTEAISVDPLVIGSASGMYGFTQMAVGELCTALAGLGQDLALTAATVLVAAGLVGQFAFWVASRRRAGD